MARETANSQLQLGLMAAASLTTLAVLAMVVLERSRGAFAGLSFQFWGGFCGGLAVALATGVVALATTTVVKRAG